jgi:hypothetical protein
LDLIVDLPPSDGYDSILTITDHDCTKASLFFPCRQTITSQGVAALYAKHVFPHFGVPSRVISDRDTRFMSNFATELCKQLDVTQNISTTYHPQTDGQSERTKQWLEQYLQIYCNLQQDNWATLLPMAQFIHNSWPNSTTGFAPFELLIGAVPRFNLMKGMSSKLPAVEHLKEHLMEVRRKAQEAVRHAQRLVILQGERKRGRRAFKPYRVGDRVWLEGTNLKLSHPSAKLAARRYGPFRVSKVISPVVY